MMKKIFSWYASLPAGLLYLFALWCKLIDVTTTYYAVSSYGFIAEANPIVRWTMESLGSAEAMGVNFLIFFIALTLAVYKFKSKIILLTMVPLTYAVALWNCANIFFVAFSKI